MFSLGSPEVLLSNSTSVILISLYNTTTSSSTIDLPKRKPEMEHSALARSGGVGIAVCYLAAAPSKQSSIARRAGLKADLVDIE